MAKWALSTMPTARTPPACGIPYPPLPVLSCAKATLEQGWPTCSVFARHRAHETAAGPTRGRKRYPDRPQPAKNGSLAHGDDAGSKSQRTLPPAGPYLYDLTTLNDILYLSGGAILNSISITTATTTAACYSIPFGYWTLSAYGAYSQYRQQFNGNWSTMDYKSKNRTTAPR